MPAGVDHDRPAPAWRAPQELMDHWVHDATLLSAPRRSRSRHIDQPQPCIVGTPKKTVPGCGPRLEVRASALRPVSVDEADRASGKRHSAATAAGLDRQRGPNELPFAGESFALFDQSASGASVMRSFLLRAEAAFVFASEAKQSMAPQVWIASSLCSQ